MKMLSRKSISLTLLAAAILFFAVLMIAGKSNGINLDTEEKRREYIAGLEITLSDKQPVVQNIIIPSEFSEVYERYNEVQKSAGFDLWKYRGEFAVQYSYEAVNFPDDTVRVNLILYKGYLIGGDVGSTRLDGFMTGLVPKKD
jgi:hypothetical protein